MASRNISTTLKAAWQLGPRLLAYYAWYALKLRSGMLRRQTPLGGRPAEAYELRRLVQPASASAIQKLLGKTDKLLFAEADEILEGKLRLFGGEPRALRLNSAKPLHHWTAYTRSMPEGGDIKPVWEIGRFAWATTLARAYWLSRDEKYAEGFWSFSEKFLLSNPANLGPHWSSAQEVALRLIALAFSYSLVAGAQATTLGRKELLSKAIVQHADRIPPTLAYAKAQNNNHLLSEALGLWTAAALLPDHPRAATWRASGRGHFAAGVSKQVHVDGAYAQHSANYHRLMLQLGVWASLLAKADRETLPAATVERLSAATSWLSALLDEDSGQVPNLGPNDGAYILPLTVLPFADYRPALQAAAATFAAPSLGAGAWDELSLWFGFAPQKKASKRKFTAPLRIEGKDSWACLRAAQFHERPGHADQLHVDLWWRGLNIAQDAGSYVYNAPAPWDNALATAVVHNTLTLDNRDQMTRAGRFLWLDWAQASVITRDPGPQRATAQHDGYRKLGLTHRRHVEVAGSRWSVRDQVLGADLSTHTGRMHWLLPDWPYKIKGDTLTLRSPKGAITIQVKDKQLALVRQGKVLEGKITAQPILGWVSPNYGVKNPALSLVVDLHGDELRDQLTLFTFPA